MKLDKFCVKNFRRLENVEVNLSDTETILVGPNNSGKTSASMIFRLFIQQRQNFKIHDFFAPILKEIDEIGEQGLKDEQDFPSLSLDLWFSIDPDTEYGRVAHFLPSLEKEYPQIGVRIEFSINDYNKLLEDYEKINQLNPDSKKKLSEFLSKREHLKKHFSLKYFKLEDKKESIEAHPLNTSDGEKSLKSLISVDFVDAQRNIDDNEATRSTRLSSAFSDYYNENLKELKNKVEAIKVIDESNKSLSEHYEDQFKELIEIISNLGFPSVHDRKLKILSILDPESVLKGNTDLFYEDETSEHRLPESYNGLGFKNLIYMAVQISHFQRKWISIKQDQPLCHLIFIEEPEVHLHVQVQKVFIRKIRKIIETASKKDDQLTNPQLLISTHSPHIIDEAKFELIRYFQRCELESSSSSNNRKVATKVKDLKTFNSSGNCKENTTSDNFKENIKFLQKYLKLVHCDLFFSDAVILVEGTVEKLLLPKFIEKSAENLNKRYLTVLEVGGAHAHKIVPLVEFIGLPTLIISDLDSVDPENQKTCKANEDNAISSNSTIKKLVPKEIISDLLETPDKKSLGNTLDFKISYLLKMPDKKSGTYKYKEQIHLVFQGSVVVNQNEMIPRTFEDAFIYENLEFIKKHEKLCKFITFKKNCKLNSDDDTVYEAVKSKNYKKTDFALNLIDIEEEWKTPEYISKGLKWLDSVVSEKGDKKSQPESNLKKSQKEDKDNQPK